MQIYKDSKVGVVGGRDFLDVKLMRHMLNKYRVKHGIGMIISGGAKGADTLAYEYAVKNGITFVCYPPIPEEGFPRAYFRRNIRIVEASEVIIAFPTSDSKGTWHTINTAKKLGKICFVIAIKNGVIVVDKREP